MSTGLLALLDDVAALVKVSAASLDDIPAQVAKTSGKVTGIVIDDAAVTPKYVVGLSPERELGIIARIARRSLVNKLVLLGPAAIAAGAFAPWLIQPVLMLGGGYLCFEGYEKLHSLRHAHAAAPEAAEAISPEELEALRIQSAVQTDLILSAEIIAITYATVEDADLATQAAVIFCIAVGLTAAVYGFVGLIVKADDIGLHLAKRGHAGMRALGRGIVKGMPHFLSALGMVGTAAMLWVGAEIVSHGIAPLHHALLALERQLADTPLLAWGAKALVCATGGAALGACLHAALTLGKRISGRKA